MVDIYYYTYNTNNYLKDIKHDNTSIYICPNNNNILWIDLYNKKNEIEYKYKCLNNYISCNCIYITSIILFIFSFCMIFYNCYSILKITI
jgi:hypothetical protein